MYFFFIKAQSNLEQCIDMLQYINDKNKERIEKNMNKIPIIFIKNGEDLISKDKPVFFQYLKNELKKYNLSDLYDSTINNNNNSNKIEEKDEDDFFKDEEDTTNNYENYIDGNFIQIHIPTGKNINKIFPILNEYLKKYNKLLIDKNQNEFLQMKDNSQKLINYYIKEKIQKKSLSKEEEKELDLLYNKCNKFVKKLKNQCSILYNLDILNRKSKWKKILSGIFMGIFLILPIVNILAIWIYYKCCINFIAFKYGFDEQDIKKYGLYEYIYGKNEKKEKFDEKKIEEKIENIIFYIGPIQCALKAKELFSQIFHCFEELSMKNEKDWNIFKIEKL